MGLAAGYIEQVTSQVKIPCPYRYRAPDPTPIKCTTVKKVKCEWLGFEWNMPVLIWNLARDYSGATRAAAAALY